MDNENLMSVEELEKEIYKLHLAVSRNLNNKVGANAVQEGLARIDYLEKILKSKPAEDIEAYIDELMERAVSKLNEKNGSAAYDKLKKRIDGLEEILKSKNESKQNENDNSANKRDRFMKTLSHTPVTYNPGQKESGNGTDKELFQR